MRKCLSRASHGVVPPRLCTQSRSSMWPEEIEEQQNSKSDEKCGNNQSRGLRIYWMTEDIGKKVDSKEEKDKR